jgi:hypothetical protein
MSVLSADIVGNSDKTCELIQKGYADFAVAHGAS